MLCRAVIALACAVVQAAGSPGVWLEVPYVSQPKNGCGAASIAMVIEYWQKQKVDVASIHDALYSRGARGVLASEMERYFKRQGFQTFSISGEWGDLQQHLRKGRPPIVALKTGASDLHYVVITGFDPQENVILKHDAAVRPLVKQHRADFEKQWKGAGNWMLLALPER